MTDAGRLRVLVVGKGAPERGGIATLVELLRSRLAPAHDVRLVNLTRVGEPSFGQLSWANLKRTVEDAAAVFRGAAGRDVVNVHSALAPGTTMARAGVLAAAARLRGSSVVLHAHGGNLETWLQGRTRRLLTKVALAPASVVVTVAEDLRTSLGAVIGERRVRLVDNGVDLDAFSPALRPPDRPVILYVGLLTPRKGVLDLVEASKILRTRGIDHEVVLVGGTPDEGVDAEHEVRTAAEGTATLLGPRPASEMPSVYGRGTVFCLPSWWEAMPLSILEAMASGLPVVATDTGDIPKLVANGETGTLVPVRQPDRLADALQPYLEDAALAARAGGAGRRRAEEHFGLDRMLDATITSYHDALSSSRRRRSR
jgi:glycosyltransferase involved in cell wall biosynthesis